MFTVYSITEYLYLSQTHTNDSSVGIHQMCAFLMTILTIHTVLKQSDRYLQLILSFRFCIWLKPHVCSLKVWYELFQIPSCQSNAYVCVWFGTTCHLSLSIWLWFYVVNCVMLDNNTNVTLRYILHGISDLTIG